MLIELYEQQKILEKQSYQFNSNYSLDFSDPHMKNTQALDNH